MHDKIAAGAFTDILFDDHRKIIEGVAKIIDDDAWEKCREGVFTGLSIGGSQTKHCEAQVELDAIVCMVPHSLHPANRK